MDMSDEDRGQPISEEDQFVRTERVLDSSVDDERIVLDTDSEMYYGLNRVGAYLWDELEEPHTVEELVASTTEEFDIEPPECQYDVQTFLTELLEVDLIERV